MSQNLGGNDSSNWMSICLKWIEVTNSSIVVFVGKNAGNNICSKTFFLRKKKAAAKGNKDMFLFRWRKFRQFEVLQKKTWFTVGKGIHDYFCRGVFLINVHDPFVTVFWQDPIDNHGRFVK